MASTTKMLVKKFKALEDNAAKFEEVTERPSSKTYPFFSEDLKTRDAIDPAELIPLLSGQNIGPKKK